MEATVRPIGVVRSVLKSRAECPKQGWEGAPDAWLELDAIYAEAVDGLTVGSEIIVLTWLHQSRRNTLRVHPRGCPENQEKGVFATRSPDRPNPIGIHEVKVLEIEAGTRIRVRPIEVIDGTPVLDIKPLNC